MRAWKFLPYNPYQGAGIRPFDPSLRSVHPSQPAAPSVPSQQHLWCHVCCCLLMSFVFRIPPVPAVANLLPPLSPPKTFFCSSCYSHSFPFFRRSTGTTPPPPPQPPPPLLFYHCCGSLRQVLRFSLAWMSCFSTPPSWPANNPNHPPRARELLLLPFFAALGILATAKAVVSVFPSGGLGSEGQATPAAPPPPPPPPPPAVTDLNARQAVLGFRYYSGLIDPHNGDNGTDPAQTTTGVSL